MPLSIQMQQKGKRRDYKEFTADFKLNVMNKVELKGITLNQLRNADDEKIRKDENVILHAVLKDVIMNGHAAKTAANQTLNGLNLRNKTDFTKKKERKYIFRPCRSYFMVHSIAWKQEILHQIHHI